MILRNNSFPFNIFPFFQENKLAVRTAYVEEDIQI